MPLIFDPNKPISGTRFVSADVRDNLNALSRANDLRPSEQVTPDLTVLVQAGRFLLNAASVIEFTGGSSPVLDTTTGGVAGQERIVVLQIDANANLVFKLGNWATAGSALTPSFDADKIAIAEILHTFGQTTITDNDIMDIRPFVNLSAGGAGTIDPGKVSITATDVLGPGLGQIDFDTSSSFQYTINQDEILVFVDGVYQASTIDYTEPDNITVRFNSAIPAGSLVCVWKVGLSASPGSIAMADLSDIDANQTAGFQAANAPTAINPFLTESGHTALDHSTVPPIPTILTDITALQGHVTAVSGAHAATAISVVDNLTFANPTNVQEAVDAMQTIRNDFLAQHTVTGTHGPRITINQTDAGSALSVVDITNAGTGNDIEGNANNWFIDKSGNATFATVTANGASPGIIINQTAADNAVEVNKTNVGGGSAIIVENDGTGQGLLINQTGDGRGLQISQNASSQILAFFNKIGGSNNCIEISNSGSGNDIRGNANNWSIASSGIANFSGISFTTGTSFRMLWGHVSAAGTIVNAGSGGWTVVRVGLGNYNITFSPAFAAPALMQYTPIGGVQSTTQMAITPSASVAQAFPALGGTAADIPFHFIAIGAV